MGIHSDAFGRVTLTNEDARKFENQVRYGRPSKEAKEAVAKGAEAVKNFQRDGMIRFSVKKAG
ncbi:hypothetical protein [Affinirhizobium pseudoryzae]|uniref:hypothetical protein n=1 Tax=Allorhizobium pseudoryzae TaxID=379684 RepID=UPI0013EB2889|nr:hypothetical protein [Allorhizobium pseudoryzae]